MMNIQNQYKGVLYGSIALLLVSMQPIVANSRPSELDSFLYATLTCSFQTFIFFPLFILERRNLKSKLRNSTFNTSSIKTQLRGWRDKKNILILFYIGISFAIAQIFFFLAYQIGGTINTALAQQTTIIFALLFGFLINHEKIKVGQILFSFLLFLGLMMAITQGTFKILEINQGVFFILITTILWTSGHAITKPLLDKGLTTPIQLVFLRNIIGGLFLLLTYFIFFPLSNIFLIFKPINLFYSIVMGFLYGFDLLFWYLCLKNLPTSKASVIISPMPILTALLAMIFLGESFTIFHLFGALIIIFCIYMIVKQKKKKD